MPYSPAEVPAPAGHLFGPLAIRKLGNGPELDAMLGAMDLIMLDLNLPADVHWRNPSPHKPAFGGRKQKAGLS
jgi:hypothetical protein